METYEELVQRGRELVSGHNWILGDLALKVVIIKDEGSLQQYADDIGIEGNTLKDYRYVSAAYGSDDRSSECSWTVHQIFAAQEDRAELVKGNWSTARARAEVRVRKAVDEPVLDKPVNPDLGWDEPDTEAEEEGEEEEPEVLPEIEEPETGLSLDELVARDRLRTAQNSVIIYDRQFRDRVTTMRRQMLIITGWMGDQEVRNQLAVEMEAYAALLRVPNK